MRKIILMVLFLIISGMANFAIGQHASARMVGRVINSENKKPIEGASIIILGDNSQAKSDSDGEFALKANHGDSVLVSHIGYHSETVLYKSGTSRLTIMLVPLANVLDEVMVSSGYQQLRPNEMTGAFQVLDKKTLDQQVGTNILDRLNNVTPGFRKGTFEFKPNRNEKLNISFRGLSTIEASKDPLIVLDGFIYEGDIDNIDPNSIASVTVLKDAAATSIWGARAGNGVIVLTSINSSNKLQKTTVNISHTVTTKRVTDYSKLYQPANLDYILAEQELFNAGYYDGKIEQSPYLALTPTAEVFLARRRGLISAQDSTDRIAELLAMDGKAAYRDAFLSNPFLQQSFANISGASTVIRYSFGVGNTMDLSENKAKDNKINLYLNNSFHWKDKFELNLNVNFLTQKQRSGTSVFDQFRYSGKYVPFFEFMNAEGEALPFNKGYRGNYLNELYGDKLLDWNYYPLNDYELDRATTRKNELYAVLQAKYNIKPYLTATVSYQYQIQRKVTERIAQAESYYARNLINMFSNIDPQSGVVAHPIPIGGIYDLNNGDLSSYTWRGQLNFNRSFGSHHVNGILGAEIREVLSKGSTSSSYGYSADPIRTKVVDYAGFYPTLPAGGYAAIQGNISLMKSLNRFVSHYANVAYLFRQRYGLSASIRKDGANVFGVNTNDKFNPFWSVGASWQIRKEKFADWKVVDALQLRATYGYSGNIDPSRTPLPVAETTSGRYTNYPAFVISTLNDPSLRWEKVRTLNLGLQFGLFKNRITGSFDYYVKKSTDLYGNSLIDYTVFGKANTTIKNNASIRSQGAELTMTLEAVRTPSFSWRPAVLLSMNKNKVLEYYNTQFGLINLVGNGTTTMPIVGRPLNSIAAFNWGGLDQNGDPQGFLDGELSTDYQKIRNSTVGEINDNQTIVYVGSAVPQLFGNLINTFSYRNFELSFNLSFKADYYFSRQATTSGNFYMYGKAYADYEKRWQAAGDENYTQVPRVKYPIDANRDAFYQGSKVNVLKGDHVRVEYINLSWRNLWQLGSKKLNTRMFFNASNLGLIWKRNKEGVDPDFPGRLTPNPTYAIGLNVGF
ncbi:SusC/RagA family TonB-linked outer membrane protein [Sphingobacterium thalpophilum]|uniref:SusC/RagA family TonB-linked outer membrane protein n=1 Tax=Sphingobacterium thalpophilum TaxID=259 RepID=A0ACD5C0A9_9SPHI